MCFKVYSQLKYSQGIVKTGANKNAENLNELALISQWCTYAAQPTAYAEQPTAYAAQPPVYAAKPTIYAEQVGAELCQAQYRLVNLGLHRFPTKLLLKYNFELILTRNNKQVLINSYKFSTFV